MDIITLVCKLWLLQNDKRNKAPCKIIYLCFLNFAGRNSWKYKSTEQVFSVFIENIQVILSTKFFFSLIISFKFHSLNGFVPFHWEISFFYWRGVSEAQCHLSYTYVILPFKKIENCLLNAQSISGKYWSDMIVCWLQLYRWKV